MIERRHKKIHSENGFLHKHADFAIYTLQNEQTCCVFCDFSVENLED